MCDRLKMALWFYTGADYLIINSFLWQNRYALDECIQIVWNNNRNVIREAEEQTPKSRFGFSGIDEMRLYESYRARTPETLSDKAKGQMLDQAMDDIRCICHAMHLAHQEMKLIRNVDRRYAIKDFDVGGKIELKGLTSTSTTGQLIDYGKEDYRKPGQILRIHVAAGLPFLSITENNENEVILPPMVYRVLDRYEENETEVVDLQAMCPLDLERLIGEAKAACRE